MTTALDNARAQHARSAAHTECVIRVASVPSSHVYVRHLSPTDDTVAPLDATAVGESVPRVIRLDDPDPDEPGRSAVLRWWPPVMLESEWVREHRDFDVFHLQFGFDARSPRDLADLVAALRETGRPLVYTVHDLRNPHHESSVEHDAALDVLVPAADALLTLTPGAAAEIRERWGRDARVLPHPHVVPFDRMQRRRAERRPGDAVRIGVHVKSLRASMDPLPVLRVLADVVRRIPGGILQVNGHRDVLLPSGARYDRKLATFLLEEEERGGVDVRVHDFFSDDELWDYLQSLDVSVLPYRFGTHSGWLEACRDLGTAVIAPTCGYYREQGPVFSYRHGPDGLDAQSLADAVDAAVAAGSPAAMTIDERMTQRRGLADAHAALYRDLLG